MTPLEIASAEWQQLHHYPSFHAPIDPTSPMGGCMVRFAPDGRVVLVWGGTYTTYADDVQAIRAVIEIQSRVAEETRRAMAAKSISAGWPGSPKRPSLDDLELEF